MIIRRVAIAVSVFGADATLTPERAELIKKLRSHINSPRERERRVLRESFGYFGETPLLEWMYNPPAFYLESIELHCDGRLIFRVAILPTVTGRMVSKWLNEGKGAWLWAKRKDDGSPDPDDFTGLNYGAGGDFLSMPGICDLPVGRQPK